MKDRQGHGDRPWTEEIADDCTQGSVDEPTFEKIGRATRPRLPVSSGRKAERNSKKTIGSKRVKKMISQKSGGMHRRRQKTIR